MPRSAVIAITVLGVFALVASTTFALVRSSQLRSSRSEVAGLQSELARARGGDGARPSPEASPDGPLDEQGDNPLGDLLPEEGGGLEDLFGGDAQQLAQCVQPAGPLGSRDVGDTGVDDQIGQIAGLVEQLRELRFRDDPAPEFLDDAQITERLEQEVRTDYDEQEADLDRRTLAAMGAVPAGIDLIEVQTDLLTGQVAGFYDPESEELVVRAAGADDGLDPVAQSTLAHELQHALADQVLELPVDITENSGEGDAALAALAVIEGDATLTQQQFSIVGMSLSEQLGLGADPDALAAQRQLADVPHYLAQSLQFPYLAGLRFACARYLDGGWAAIDATYDDLPTTSAEILEPDRYGTPAVDPRDPGDLGGDWQRARTTTVGAADLLWLFQAPGDETSRALDDPRERALAWTGGELTVWTDGDATGVGVALTQRDEGGPLCDALTTWYQRAFPDGADAPTRRDERMVREGPEQTAVITCPGDEVRVGIAPDVATARALAG